MSAVDLTTVCGNLNVALTNYSASKTLFVRAGISRQPGGAEVYTFDPFLMAPTSSTTLEVPSLSTTFNSGETATNYYPLDLTQRIALLNLTTMVVTDTSDLTTADLQSHDSDMASFLDGKVDFSTLINHTFGINACSEEKPLNRHINLGPTNSTALHDSALLFNAMAGASSSVTQASNASVSLEDLSPTTTARKMTRDIQRDTVFPWYVATVTLACILIPFVCYWIYRALRHLRRERYMSAEERLFALDQRRTAQLEVNSILNPSMTMPSSPGPRSSLSSSGWYRVV
jgi:hypothetical protein